MHRIKALKTSSENLPSRNQHISKEKIDQDLQRAQIERDKKDAFTAAYNQDWETVKRLITEKRVTPNARIFIAKASIEVGFLSYAGNDSVKRELIRLGVPIDIRLIRQVFSNLQSNNWAPAFFYLKHNALDINLCYQGMTLLDWAYAHENVEVAGILLNNSAKTSYEGAASLSAIDEAVLASQCNSTEKRWNKILTHLKLVTEKGQPLVNIYEQCQEGKSLISYAMSSDISRVIHAFAMREMNAENAKQWSFEFARKGQWRVADAFIKLEKISLRTLDETGKTLQYYYDQFVKPKLLEKSAFHAAKKKNWMLVYSLIEQERVGPDIVDDEGNNLLDYAVQLDVSQKVLISLIKLGVPIKLDPLAFAFSNARESRWNLVIHLLNISQINVNDVYEGITLMDLAELKQEWGVVQSLLEIEEAFNREQDYGQDFETDLAQPGEIERCSTPLPSQRLEDVEKQLDSLSLSNSESELLQAPVPFMARYTPLNSSRLTAAILSCNHEAQISDQVDSTLKVNKVTSII